MESSRTSRSWAVGLVVVGLALGACAGDDDEQAQFAIADGQFEQCVRDGINKPEGELTEVDVGAVVHLECQDYQITDLAGIEYFHELRTLYLWENQLTDITPLAGVPTLEAVDLGNNQITDIAALAGLVGISRLGLADNAITDLTPLAGLPRLRWLSLDHNGLTDGQVAQLCEAPWITWLTIEHNRIANPAALDCLAPCDVYAEYQAAAKSALATGMADLSSILAPQSGYPDFASGRLEHRVGDDGRVGFDYVIADRRYPVIAEFAGGLRLDSTSLVYSVGDVEVVVGEISAQGIALCEGVYADVCRAALGKKGPWDGSRTVAANPAPVFSLALDLSARQGPARAEVKYGAANEELLPYALASPNQADAGSCLFMANTGAVEVLLNQHADLASVDYKGDTDLSERYLMNASDYVPRGEIDYVLTDLLYTYNYHEGSLLDRDYPFVAGYVVDTSSGVARAESGDDGAYLSCSYNWFDDLPDNWESLLVVTPTVERTPIFVDPLRDESSQWRVALMDNTTVELIKHELLTKRAPVVIVYNHYLYWHTDIIVGYDDDVDSNGCPMVESSLEYFDDEGATTYSSKIRRHMADLGGCTDRGVFYIRDSIYSGTSQEPTYNYGNGYSDRYSERIRTRSYNWIRYLANHAYTVHRR